MDESASEAFFLYDDGEDEDCEDCDHLQMNDYDEYYDDSPAQDFTDIYNYCLTPSITDTAKYFYPLVLAAILFRIFGQNRKFVIIKQWKRKCLAIFHKMTSSHKLHLLLHWYDIFLLFSSWFIHSKSRIYIASDIPHSFHNSWTLGRTALCQGMFPFIVMLCCCILRLSLLAKSLPRRYQNIPAQFNDHFVLVRNFSISI